MPSGQEGEDALPIRETVENDQEQDDAANEQPAQSGVGPMNGNFMNFGGGDMNQMQMMMAMQNGMNPAAFGSFPMMGKSSLLVVLEVYITNSYLVGVDMGMTPMMMQNMFMNGGFGAQGMNGMSMNMGMNGLNGGGNDWNGQQSWNVGQDNFNPNAPSMGNGDFGNFNTGFRNYGHQNQFNDYRRGNYGFRGRGRGRNFYGGYNRGGYHQQGFNTMNGNWAEQMNQFSGGSGSQSTANGNEAANGQGTESKTGKEVDEFGRTIRPGSGQDVQAGENGQGDGHDAAEGPDNLVSHEKSASADVQQSGEAHNDLANGSGDVSSAGQRPIPQGPASLIGRQSPMVEAPLNAPTGPKAMRQGLPNTSFHRLKARGLIASDQGPSSGADAQAVASPLEDRPKSRSSSPHSRKDLDRHHREHGRDRDLDEKSRGRHGERSRSRSPSRSRSRDRRESRRHRRHRSESLPGEGHGDEHRDRRHKNKRKSTREDDYSSRSKDDKYAPASRSPSPDDREHKRSSHRSHRDRDEKRRDRDKDNQKESDHDRHRKSGHRSHRDRDRDRDYDRDRDREREKDRDHERRKDRREREKDRRHRGAKSSATPLTPIEPSDKAFNPPTGPRGSFSIKGASNKPASGAETKGANSRPSDSSRIDQEPSRRASQSSTAGQKAPPTGPSKDPHTLEREARDRERLLKEAQRIAGLAGLAGKKRGRDGGEERSGRRKSRRSEAVNTDEEEARMRRLEAEREGRRWE